jgi:hypothetical protein
MKEAIIKSNATVFTPGDSMRVEEPLTLQPVTRGDFTGIAWQLPDNCYFYAGFDNSTDPPTRVLVPTQRVKG